MTEDFNLEAFRYLIDELDAPTRAAFEAQLARDPSARVALEACRESVAQFARESAPAAPLSPAAQRATLAAVLATAQNEPRQLTRSINWRRVAWPLAAALLLGLNLVQFFSPVIKEVFFAGKKSGALANQTSPSRQSRDAQPGEIKSTGQNASATPESERLRGLVAPNVTVTQELHRLEKLRSEYAELDRARVSLSSEYDGIVRQLAQHALVSKGVGRLAAMELVDADSYARGERKGLVDIAKGLLTEPGIVAVTPTNPPADPIAEPNPTTTTLTPVVPNDKASTIDPRFLVPPVTPTDTPATVPEEKPQTATPPKDQQPYAWSVFDETASRGYLNLYNLPATSTDQSLQLWVKPANSTTYQRMGEVPAQFYGGSGSLYYSLPGETQTPSEILVTQEPRNATPTQPTGRTVLRGP